MASVRIAEKIRQSPERCFAKSAGRKAETTDREYLRKKEMKRQESVIWIERKQEYVRAAERKKLSMECFAPPATTSAWQNLTKMSFLESIYRALMGKFWHDYRDMMHP